MGAIINFEDLYYSYPRSSEDVLKDINFQIRKGEFIAVLGENGAGKTTLCKCINGIIPHTERGDLRGKVEVAGVNTQNASTSQLAQKVGIVLEDPSTQLFTTKVISEVAFGLENLNRPVEEIKERVSWALDVVGLLGYEERPPTALSGGQKQRLALAAALSMRPEIIILDEPTAQLDPLGTDEIFEVIRKLKKDYKMTIIMATHKTDKILNYADRICILNDGELRSYRTPEETFTDSELLCGKGIRTPTIFQLWEKLIDCGIDLDEFSTEKEGIDVIKSRVKEVM